MPKGHGHQDPIGTYIEWTQHRYDPGHYLGGTIEPHLRKSTLGPKARRRSGVLLLVSGGIGLAMTASIAAQDQIGFVFAAGIYSLLPLCAGAVMLRSAAQSRRNSRTHRR